MAVSRKNFSVIFAVALISIVEYMALSTIDFNGLDYNGLISTYAVIVFSNLVVQIIAMKLSGINMLSPIFIFIIFGYVFHFGQLLMNNIYEYDYLNYLDVYMSRDMTALLTTIKVCLSSLNAVFIGALIFMLFHGGKSEISHHVEVEEFNERQICYIVGIVLLIISTPFRLIIDATQMIAAMMGGYRGAINAVSLPGVFSAVAGFWYSAMLLVYIGKRRKSIFWIGIAYATLSMLTGNRGHQITNILVMLMVYIHVEDIKPKLSKILKYGILAYFFLIFIDMIMNFRSVGIQGFFSDFGYYFTQSLQANIIFETIGSFGETLYTPFLVIKQMGNQLNPFIGEALIYSLGTLIPDIGGITSYTNVASNFAKMIDTQSAIGGSFVGDLYYNFRSGYWVVALLLGYLLCKYSDRYKQSINLKQYSKLIYYIPIFSNAFWWVRDSVGNEMRPLVWQIVISFAVVSIYKSKRTTNY